MQEENILGTERLSKLFVKFSLPAVASMIISGIQGIIDGLFLGNFVGQNAMASVNLVLPFTQIIIGISMVVSIGSLSLMGIRLGANMKEEAQNVFKTAFVTLLSSGIVIAIVGFVFNRHIGIILGASDVLIQDVASYIKVISLFAPFTMLMFLCGFTDRLIGKPELYLKGTIISMLVNVSLNYIFIKQLGWEVAGAALATGIAFCAALSVVIGPMLKPDEPVNMFKGKFDKSVILPVAYNGSSEGITSISTSLEIYLFNMAFMRISGEAGIAAFTVINYISNFVILAMFGISDGIGPIVSYNYGYEKVSRVKGILKMAIMTVSVLGAVLFVGLYMFGDSLISMFARENEIVMEMAITGCKLFSFAFLLNGINIVTSGYFTSLGDAKSSFLVSMSRGIVFVIVGITLLPKFMGTRGVWLTVPFAEFMAFLVGMILLRRTSKRLTFAESEGQLLS